MPELFPDNYPDPFANANRHELPDHTAVKLMATMDTLSTYGNDIDNNSTQRDFTFVDGRIDIDWDTDGRYVGSGQIMSSNPEAPEYTIWMNKESGEPQKLDIGWDKPVEPVGYVHEITGDPDTKVFSNIFLLTAEGKTIGIDEGEYLSSDTPTPPRLLETHEVQDLTRRMQEVVRFKKVEHAAGNAAVQDSKDNDL